MFGNESAGVLFGKKNIPSASATWKDGLLYTHMPGLLIGKTVPERRARLTWTKEQDGESGRC